MANDKPCTGIVIPAHNGCTGYGQSPSSVLFRQWNMNMIPTMGMNSILLYRVIV